MKRSTWQLLLCVAGILGAISFGASHRGKLVCEEPASTAEKTIHRASGSLEPASAALLRNETGLSATLQWVVPEGKQVQKGTLLAELVVAPLIEEREELRLHSDSLKAQLRAAEAALASAMQLSKAELAAAEQALEVASSAQETYERGELPLQVKTLEAELALAEKSYELAARLLRRLKDIPPDPDVEAQLAQAETKALEAQMRVEVVKAKHGFVTTFGRALKTKELQLEVAQRELDVARARIESEAAIRQGEAELIALKAESQRHSQRLARLEERVAAAKVYAPQDGTVIYARQRSEPGRDPPRPRIGGRLLQRGVVLLDQVPILRVADMSRLRLEVNVPLSVGQKVTTGQEVSILVDALPQDDISGRIAGARVVQKPLLPPDEAALTILVENPAGRLRAGMTAQALLEVSPKE